MSDAVLPSLIGMSFPVTKTPMWKTKVQTATSGKETRIGMWSYPIWQYSIDFDVLRSNSLGELQQLVGFYNARNGSFDSFLFLDPDDYVQTSQVIGTGNGVQTQFAVFRTYGGYAEPVRDLISGTFVFYVNGSGIGGASFNFSTGIVTFPSAPGAGTTITWSGQYRWRCRFLDDQIDLSKFMKDLWELKALRFQSIK